MKNFFFRKIPLFLFGLFLTINMSGQSITKSFKSTPLVDVLEEVKRQTGFSILYEKKGINEKKRITENFNNTPVKQVLNAILDKNVDYSVESNVITLFPKKEIKVEQVAQNGAVQTIIGKVIDASGETIIGAAIRVKGSNSNAITDLDGGFKIKTENGGQLEISCIGYTTQILRVDDKLEYVITLQENLHNLEEVVVVGYGTQKKVNLSGSVAAISSEQLKDRVQTNVLSAAQGAVPGVTIISRPGAAPSINFRGRGNLKTSAPLFVIDGAVSNATFFGNLDPNSIESISFLKDAASSAIYGSRAAFGVVLVTTKQGAPEKIQVSYSGMMGMNTPTYKPKYVNSGQYAELMNESKYNSNPSVGKFARYSAEEIGWFRDGSKPDLYPNTDWVDLVLDDWSTTTQHSVNFTGGSKKVRFFAGLGYLYENEYLPNRHKDRYNGNVNLTSELTDWLTFRAGVKYIQNVSNVDGGTPSFNNFAIVPSTFVAKQSNGEWGSVESGKEASAGFIVGNPLRALSRNDWSKSKLENSMFDAGIDISPIKGLIISGDGVYTRSESKDKSYAALVDDVPSFLTPGAIIGGTGNTINKMNMSWSSSNRLMFTTTARYEKTMGVHNFNVLLGTSYEKYNFEQLSASREGFPWDGYEDMSGGSTSGASYQNGTNSYGNKMLSYFGRINYILLDRYILEANLRADGSSRFHKDNRWGYFPSFSAAWRVSEEKFLEGQKKWLDNLKIRVSYGTLGNIDNVGQYEYMALYMANRSYSFSDKPITGIMETKPANKGLKWETVAITDIGIDFDLWGGKLSGTADYYIKNTNNILLAYSVAAETGISNAPAQNLGKLRNSGFELALTHRNKVGEVSYSVSANIATNNNRIKDLYSSNNIINDAGHGVMYILSEGEAIGSFYGFKTDGLYTQADIDAGHYYTYGATIPNAGDIKYVPQRDIQYKEAITNKDRTIIGKDVPDFTYGLNLNANYKNFELTVFGQGVSGTKVAFQAYGLHPFFHGQDNPRQLHLSRWSEANPNANAYYPRIYETGDKHTAYNRAFSEYNLFDADYFRIKTITLGYALPRSLVSKAGLTSTKFFVTAENLFTIRADKKMKDFDPETAGGVIQNLGIKSLALGVNVSF